MSHTVDIFIVTTSPDGEGHVARVRVMMGSGAACSEYQLMATHHPGADFFASIW